MVFIGCTQRPCSVGWRILPSFLVSQSFTFGGSVALLAFGHSHTIPHLFLKKNLTFLFLLEKVSTFLFHPVLLYTFIPLSNLADKKYKSPKSVRSYQTGSHPSYFIWCYYYAGVPHFRVGFLF